MRTHRFPLMALLAMVAVALSTAVWAVQTQAPRRAQPDPDVLAEFQKHVDVYVATHRKVEATIPGLSDNATPAEITNHKTSLANLIRAARSNAAQGDVLTPAMQLYVRRVVAAVLAGPDGANLKGIIMDENPVGLVVKVNDRYPSEVPLSTMPADILAALPKLPEELEYRFIGSALIIRDEHADLIVDFVPNALPK